MASSWQPKAEGADSAGGHLLGKAIEAVRREGLGRCAGRLGRQLLRGPALERYAIVAWDIAKDMPVLEAEIPIVCQVLRREELEEFARVDFYDKPVVLLESRFDEGQICFVARHEGEIVSAGWVEFGVAKSTGSLGRVFPLTPYEAYMHSGFTVPRCRGKRVRPAALSFQFKWLARSGCRRAVGIISLHNTSNLRMYPKGGGRQVGTAGHLTLLGWRWHFCSVRGAFAELERRNYLERIRAS